MTPLLRIGARGSALSLRQTQHVRARLAALLGVAEDALPITPITTSGDKQQDGRLIETGGKGLFTKELDEALRDGRIDIAVHSLKDLPTNLPSDIALACVPEREDPRDAFVSTKAASLADLPPGATVGTASLRRQAQTLYARPDLKVAVLRGNVDTRIKKLEAGVADATYLARAGLKRLGLEHHARSLVEPDDMPPAACQGALAITTRADDAATRDRLTPLEDSRARIEIEAERAFLDSLDGSCRTPIAALARRETSRIYFIGEVLTPDGRQRWRRSGSCAILRDPIVTARDFGEAHGASIRDEAGDALLMET